MVPCFVFGGNMVSFSRMKSFRKNGKTVAILKITLPKLCEEGAFSDYFNSFYSSCADSYIKAFEKAIDVITCESVIKFSVSFSVLPPSSVKLRRWERENVEFLICIKRASSINGEEKESFIDVFNKEIGVIIR